MAYSEEFISGGAGLLIGSVSTQPEIDWLAHFQVVLEFFWPVVYGGLMALGTHLMKKAISKYSQNKNEIKVKDLIKLITTNVKGSILTTILGCIIFLAGLVSMFWTNFSTPWVSVEIMIVGVVIACLKDPKRNNNKNGKGGGNAATLVFLIFLLVSCEWMDGSSYANYGGAYLSKSPKSNINWIGNHKDVVPENVILKTNLL